MITRSGPILKVDDVAATMDYWVTAMGFCPGIRVEQNGCVTYGSVMADGAEIHFGGEGTPEVTARVFLWVDGGIEEYYRKLQASGARVGEPPVIDHWGGKVFTVYDNNGHEIQVLQRQGGDDPTPARAE